MTPLDVHHIAQVLTQWTGARYKNFYHDKEKVILQIHKENMLTLHITPTQIYQDEKGEMPEKPTPLAQSIRSNLEGTKIEKVEQIGTERIIQITFKGRETKIIIIELFSTGNVILLDEKQKIIIAKTYKEWKDRSIKTGEQYKLPPQQKNILEATPQELERETTKNEDNIEKTLARTYGLGGEFAKIIVAQTKTPAPKHILETFKKIWTEKPSENSLKMREMGRGTRDLTTSSQLTDKNKEKTRQREKKKEQINKRIKMQEERLQELEKEAEENTRKGELIYENYARVKEELSGHKKEFSLEFKTMHK